MEEELHAVDFVDYHAIFSDALTCLGKGMSVSDALDVCLKERYPLTFKETKKQAISILSYLERERGWGSVRALRELAARAELAEEIRSMRGCEESGRGLEETRRPDVIADYPQVFSLALRKRQSGFSLEDSLEMAVRELYPQTFRKVKDAALFYIRLAAQRRGEHELRALRDLAEDPGFFEELEKSLKE